MSTMNARDTPVPQRSEGDTNVSSSRQEFIASHLDDRTRELLDRDAAVFLHQALSTPCLNGLESVSGSHLVDLNGRQILDFHGNSVHQLGHAHTEVIEAVKDQLDALAFCPRRYTNEPAIELAETLVEISPVRSSPTNARVLFAPAGTLAIGMALKLARFATGRFKTISMWGAFHGASLDAISIGGEAEFRQGMGPLLPGCVHVPPYSPTGIGAQSLEYLEYVFAHEPEISAVITEPMRWTTVVAPPVAYWQRVRALCDQYGALLIMDEVPSCLGRTGRMFCCEHAGIEPDILVIGKGLGGGVFPFAAMVARGDLDVASNVSLGHYTHEKSPVGSAVALETIKIIRRDRLVERAERLGTQALASLTTKTADLESVHEVRGVGLQIAIELRTKLAADFGDRVLYDCLRRGLSFKVSSGNLIVLCPPLTISEDELEQAIDILVSSIGELEHQMIRNLR